MSEIPPGYRVTPPEDAKKAKAFFDRGAAVAGTGNYEYAIEMYLQGLDKDPEAVDAHQALRDISLKRKASGGKSLGMMQRMKIKTNTKDDKANMLASEKLLAYDPGNTDNMLLLIQNAHRAGCYDTVMWIGPIFQKANTDGGKPDISKYLALKDIYKALGHFKLASDAALHASQMRPDDMDLITELKNLGAQHTMTEGKYGSATSFRDSVRDMDSQRKLLDSDKDVRTDDAMSRLIAEAEVEWKASPDEPGKIMKLAEALVKTELPENDARAIDLLTSAHERTKQFRFRLSAGRIRMAQLGRLDRSFRERITKDPSSDELKQEYRQFIADRAEEELKELTLWTENYPMDLGYKYEQARRLFVLQRFSEAIPVLQTARQDPKIRTDATVMLGRAFLDAGFVDEAVETLRTQIEEYQLKGDAKSKEMYYWYARSLEAQNEAQSAIKALSQVAQWDFNYRDVQGRIKKLRSAAAGPAE